jgi:HSP20 family protein
MRSHLVPGRREDLSHLRDSFFFPIEQVFDNFFDEFWGASKTFSRSGFNYPKMDVTITGDDFTIRAAIPGVDADEIKVEVIDGVVRISGEMSEEFKSEEQNYYVKELCKRKFSREVQLPEDVVDDNPEASLKNGILTLKWKTKIKEEKTKPKIIPIKTE